MISVPLYYTVMLIIWCVSHVATTAIRAQTETSAEHVILQKIIEYLTAKQRDVCLCQAIINQV
jgi:hypothetical protein